MLARHKKSQRGDSLVEVILAISVLSLVIALSWSIVNRSLQISLVARQRVVMVNALKEQAEILQAHYASDTVRSNVMSGSIISVLYASTESDIPNNPCGSLQGDGTINAAHAFHFNDRAEVTAGAKDEVKGYPGSHLWVQRAEGPGSLGGAYVDFYVRACWDTVGSNDKTDSSHFVVRLNK